jgi:hypothetical protein
MERKIGDLKIHLAPKPRRATKRPKSVVAKTVATNAGVKTRVTAVDANSSDFGADFLYVFKSNVRRARKSGRAG